MTAVSFSIDGMLDALTAGVAQFLTKGDHQAKQAERTGNPYIGQRNIRLDRADGVYYVSVNVSKSTHAVNRSAMPEGLTKARQALWLAEQAVKAEESATVADGDSAE